MCNGSATTMHWKCSYHLPKFLKIISEDRIHGSDKMWPTGEGNSKPLQYSCLKNSMNNMKWQKYRSLKDELPRWEGVQYATGEECRNNSRKNEEMEPKQKQYLVLDVTGNGRKVWCCKEQYCIGKRNVRSMNKGKLKMAKQIGSKWGK